MRSRSRLVPLSVAVIIATGLALTACASDSPGDGATPAASADGAVRSTLARLETAHHTRLGVDAIDTGTGRQIGYRADERFAFASTNKTFIAAAVLRRTPSAGLDEVVHFTQADVLAYAPITSKYVATGMTVRHLIDAMMRFSDNTAANVLVHRLGGPSVVQQYLRSIGDPVSNVDRLEPELNEATPGDPRDTTTPAQFARNLRTVLFRNGLSPSSAAILRNAMLDNTTGDGAIRHGVDPAWPVADKTGTGDRGVRNDIGIVYPSGHAPVIIVDMTTPDDPTAAADDPLIASASRVVVDALLADR